MPTFNKNNFKLNLKTYIIIIITITTFTYKGND